MIKVFISYNHRDLDWVQNWLLPKLENAGIQVVIDYRDFTVGIPSLTNMEKAVTECDKTLLVLTPNWVNSEWANFESILNQTIDPIGLRNRTIPLMVKKCDLPPRLAIFTYAHFTDKKRWDAELTKLLTQWGVSGTKTSSGTP